jgi:vacuolar-type H+-ATPase subunit E/Vma4
MKEIIEEVLKTEEKVNVILKQAREKAAEIRQSAEQENLEKIGRAKQKAKQIIQAAVEQAKKEAELVRQEELKQADGEKDSILNKTDIIDGLIDNICNIILTTENDRDSM